MTSARPALDPELHALLADMPLMSTLDTELLGQLRPHSSTPVEPLLAGRQIERLDAIVPAKDGAPIALSVFRPSHPAPASDRIGSTVPCIYWMHGGGMVMGDRFSQIDIPLEWLDRFGAVIVSVDYRPAREATGATPSEDLSAGCSGLPSTPPSWGPPNAGHLPRAVSLCRCRPDDGASCLDAGSAAGAAEPGAGRPRFRPTWAVGLSPWAAGLTSAGAVWRGGTEAIGRYGGTIGPARSGCRTGSAARLVV